MNKTVKNILINLVVFLVLLEVVSFIYIKIKRPPNERYDKIPTYLEIGKKDQYDTLTDPIGPKSIDSLYPWCTWHPRNGIHRQVSDCFDVILKFNDLGIRGSMPGPEDSNSIFFLGDSFVEGYGLHEDSTLSARIGRILNRPVLNLGASGNIGTTQMSLVYPYFAGKFRHKEVYVLMYLNNDFSDNDLSKHEATNADRYRPYRVFLSKDSSAIIYKGSMATTKLSWEQFYKEKEQGFTRLRKYGIKSYLFHTQGNILDKLSKLTFSRRFINFIAGTLKGYRNKKALELDYRPGDWRILEADIRSILDTASSYQAKVTFINLPSRQLFSYAGKEEKVGKYVEIERKLTGFIKERGGRYLSFYDYIIDNKINIESLFFSCDNHYSNAGYQVLADFIIKNHPGN